MPYIISCGTCVTDSGHFSAFPGNRGGDYRLENVRLKEFEGQIFNIDKKLSY
jgi:hypothetical protein